MMQKTFWSMTGDLLRMDTEVNTWLKKMEADGYEIVSRNQIDRGDNGIWVTYCLTRVGSADVVQRLQRHIDLLNMAFRHKEELTKVMEEIEGSGEVPSLDAMVKMVSEKKFD